MNEWDLVWRLGLALALSASIGLDRELRQKSAGLRTYTLVGVGSALFMLISKYGFFDVLEPKEVVLDPSRVAAQIVSGIGFIGAGLIFVRRDSVRGLTTAAGVWLTAAVGAAAGASLPVLAIATTLAYFVTVYVLAPLARRLPASPYAPSAVRVDYDDGRGILRKVLQACTLARLQGRRRERRARRGRPANPSPSRSRSTAAARSPPSPPTSARSTASTPSPPATSTRSSTPDATASSLSRIRPYDEGLRFRLRPVYKSHVRLPLGSVVRPAPDAEGRSPSRRMVGSIRTQDVQAVRARQRAPTGASSVASFEKPSLAAGDRSTCCSRQAPTSP